MSKKKKILGTLFFVLMTSVRAEDHGGTEAAQASNHVEAAGEATSPKAKSLPKKIEDKMSVAQLMQILGSKFKNCTIEEVDSEYVIRDGNKEIQMVFGKDTIVYKTTGVGKFFVLHSVSKHLKYRVDLETDEKGEAKKIAFTRLLYRPASSSEPIVSDIDKNTADQLVRSGEQEWNPLPTLEKEEILCR